ncbi:unnamed protein product [Caenorhabditis angaria]|uniref:Uncharacterized protein n=1 Tax=Caenorhabditis angaria TaxID=860376 RepID=A0A9P1IGA9_9PELO|nr:unnamed protein product [Caenorhabditis angaria]
MCNGEPNAKKIKITEEFVSTNQLFSNAMSGNSKNSTTSMKVDYSKYKISKKVVEQPAKEETNRKRTISPSSSSTCSAYSSSSSISSTKSKVVKTSDDSEEMFKPRKDRQKVYAGRKKSEEYQIRFNICDGIISSNLRYHGAIPYQIIKPTLLKCNLEDLKLALDKNQYLAEDADEIFEEMVKTEFPEYKNREKKENSTWKQLFEKLLKRREEKENSKLEIITERIAKAQQKNNTQRKTMLIDVFNPNVPNRPATSKITAHQPKESLKSQKIIKNQPVPFQSSKPQSETRPKPSQVRPSPPSTTAFSQISKPKNGKKKVAPLMAKCLRMLRK